MIIKICIFGYSQKACQSFTGNLRVCYNSIDDGLRSFSNLFLGKFSRVWVNFLGNFFIGGLPLTHQSLEIGIRLSGIEKE